MDTQGEAVSFSLFTKHWKDQSAPELARFVTGIGFDGIELPVRSGFPVEPERVGRDLPEFAKQLREYGVSIFSVAAPVNEAVFAACAEAGIPMIRIMIGIGQDGYKASELRAKQELEDWLPLCERYGVKLGVQPHCGNYVSDVNGLMRIIEAYPPAYVGAIWDAAHDALAGQQPEYGLDIVWSHLAMVNLKNVFLVRSNGPEAEQAEWKRHYTTGRHGFASWSRTAAYLKNRPYTGVVCLTAEYTDLERKDCYIAEDLAYAKSLFR